MSKKSGIKKSGIEHHPERIYQPYSVWCNGSIIWFAYTKEEAEEKLAEEIEKHKEVVIVK